MNAFNAVKVFSATMLAERERLGEFATEWIRSHPGIEIVDVVITQSSDNRFHCVAITLFYNQAAACATKADDATSIAAADVPVATRRLKFRSYP